MSTMNTKAFYIVCFCSGIVGSHSLCGQLPAQKISPKKTVPAQQIPQRQAQLSAPGGASEIIDETRGNWYNKRDVYRKARPLYTKIKKLAETVENYKKTFVDERKKSDTQVTEFNKKLTFTKSELQQTITRYQNQITRLQQEVLEQEANLNYESGEPEETESSKKLKAMQTTSKSLEGLSKDLELISQRDSLLDKVIATLLETLSKVRSYEQKAFTAYEEIAKTFSDEKANQLYNQMNNFADNISSLDSYVQIQLLPFLRTVQREVQTTLGSAQKTVTTLKNQKIPISTKERKEAREAQDAKRAAEEAERERARQEKRKATEASKSLWQLFISKIKFW